MPSPSGLQVQFVPRTEGEVAILSFAWPDATLLATLTQAEREVGERLLLGWSNARIADDRGRAPRTIANQVASLFRKLGVGSRSELIARYGRSR